MVTAGHGVSASHGLDLLLELAIGGEVAEPATPPVFMLVQLLGLGLGFGIELGFGV